VDEPTFDNFVVGPWNGFAHAACRYIADAPGRSYNPLVLFGPTGGGKTHLLLATAPLVRADHPGLSVSFLAGTVVHQQLVEPRPHGTVPTTLDGYGDVLLIDDVNSIVEEPPARDLLVQLARERAETNRQLLVTLSLPAPGGPDFLDRLRPLERSLWADVLRAPTRHGGAPTVTASGVAMTTCVSANLQPSPGPRSARPY